MTNIINQSPIGATYYNWAIGSYTVLCHTGNQTVIRLNANGSIMQVHFEDVGTEFIGEYLNNGYDDDPTIYHVGMLGMPISEMNRRVVSGVSV